MDEAGALRVRSFSDDEGSVEHVAGWNLHCVQMSAGSLAGESVDVQLPAIQLLFETYRNVSTSHCGTAPAGTAIFGIAGSMEGQGRFNGLRWSDGITAFDSRQELFSLVPPVELITLVMDRRVLTEYAWTTGHVDLEHWLSQGPIVLDDADLARRVSRRLHDVKTACQLGWLRGDQLGAQQRLADEVIEILCPLILRRLRQPPAARREMPHLEVVRRARDYMRERADDPPRIFDLCRALGVSRRWLQWSFNEVLDIGPWSYLHLMRLNGARRMLLHSGPDTKVNDAVEAFGFWHLSRFSRDYRTHFGELPSQTLQRALARSCGPVTSAQRAS
jgi:AraC family ethanolamine operon transcriptional activator